MLSGQIRRSVTPGIVARPAASRSSSSCSWAGPGAVQHGREGPAGLRERRDAEHVRRPRLVPVRCGCPCGVVEVDPGHGPAAREVGRRGVEPVATADQRSRPVGRVELVPGQRDVVHARRREVDAAVRGELRGVDGDPGARGVGDRHDPVQRQYLAGDVRGAGHGEQRRRGGPQRGVEIGERLRDRRGCGHGAVRPGAPGQQVRVVLDVETQDRAGHGRGQQVQCVRGVAGEDDDVVLPGPDELPDALPGPLQQCGAHLREVARAAVHAREQRQDVGDVRRDRFESGCAGGEIEVGVLGPAAGDQGNLRSRSHGPGEGGGRAVERQRHRTRSFRNGGPVAVRRVRACRRVSPRRPGRHPEHPTAEEGCRPASRGLTLALMT